MTSSTVRRLSALLVIVSTVIVTPRPSSAQEAQGIRQQGQDDRDDRRSAQSDKGDARPIEGLWQSAVTINVCQTGASIVTFRAMNMFIRGGALTVTDDASPTTRGPGLGQWRHLGGRRYSDTFRFNQFSADGTFAGTFVVSRNIVLGRGGDAFTSTVAAQIFDANDNLVENVCATETSHRID